MKMSIKRLFLISCVIIFSQFPQPGGADNGALAAPALAQQAAPATEPARPAAESSAPAAAGKGPQNITPAVPAPAQQPEQAQESPQAEKTVTQRTGHLFIIGGAEDRKDDKVLLRRFVELTGAPNPYIVVVTAASVQQDEIWNVYRTAFRQLGVKQVKRLEIASRADANSKANAEEILKADGVFMTGGDQQRLMSTIGGTRVAQAIYTAFKQEGACIGGTSAGAAVMSAHMLAEGKTKGPPSKGVAQMSAGLGLVRSAIIDQHFSERQRLGRLLSLVAQVPFLLGVGIDENTALVIEKGRGIEVLGQGAVTIVDGRNVVSNFFDVGARELLEMLNVQLHLLPAGASYQLPQSGELVPNEERTVQAVPAGRIPASLLEVLTLLTDI